MRPRWITPDNRWLSLAEYEKWIPDEVFAALDGAVRRLKNANDARDWAMVAAAAKFIEAAQQYAAAVRHTIRMECGECGKPMRLGDTKCPAGHEVEP